MSTIIKKDGFNYSFDFSACSTCQGRCCTGESGYIYVTKAEIGEIVSEWIDLSTHTAPDIK
jgi:hypothetical protein